VVADAVEEIVGDCLAVRVRMIGRVVTTVYDRALERHGVTIAQLNLLAAVGTVGPCPPTVLGEVLQLQRSTVSRNVNLLIKQGWIAVTSSDGKGAREVALTSAGRLKIKSVMPAWRAAQQETADLLGTSGVAAVRTIAGPLGGIAGE